MRYLALISVVLIACGDDGASNSNPPPPDAGERIDGMIDARMADAAIDGPPDNPAITMTCTDLCNALSTCFNEPLDPDCVDECSLDLADCTAQQVTDLDACKTEACGDEDNSPIINCLGTAGAGCVDG
jgi:hypothetical protein